MSSRYEPKDHIQHLDVAPRAEGILDQREITIQSYQTTVPFEYESLDAGLEGAWLTPQIRFGVFSRIDTKVKDVMSVVLGLQDEQTIRAYDYDERRPLWYSWQNAIVDTVNIHCFRDEDGLIRFTTTGGGRRITDDRPGHLMNSNGGTLFVDEFASFSHDLQVIFLSVLDKRSIEKIGGESFTPDVRCIFATNASVEERVRNGTLRRDLLDRIASRFCIPPLRERRGDILLLAKHFAVDQEIADRCLVALLRYHWPGNIRELQNKMAAAKARKKSEVAATIDVTHIELPPEVVSAVEALDDDACRRELWTLADEIARDEGFEHRSGLQRRAAEIMGVGDSQASKMYQAYGLARAASA